ncbi:hypothetical protein DFH09DRAFT_1278027 [Mycena vulgaris]|nr:hypothetical protein DFH09DRAFT_1278027 [Mycena vulgaris]
MAPEISACNFHPAMRNKHLNPYDRAPEPLRREGSAKTRGSCSRHKYNPAIRPRCTSAGSRQGSELRWERYGSVARASASSPASAQCRRIEGRRHEQRRRSPGTGALGGSGTGPDRGPRKPARRIEGVARSEAEALGARDDVEDVRWEGRRRAEAVLVLWGEHPVVFSRRGPVIPLVAYLGLPRGGQMGSSQSDFRRESYPA